MFPFKIAFFIPQLSSGGAERVVANLVTQFAHNGVPVLLITKERRSNEYKIPDSVSRCYVRSDINYKSRILRYIYKVKSLRTICKKNNIDVLISFNVPANYLALYATIGIKTKHIISIRNAPDFLFQSLFSRISAQMILSRSDGAVFQTPDAQEWFPKRLRKKSTIIFNPVSTQFYQIGHTPIPYRVITCGRLTKQKNHAMLIKAFSDVVNIVDGATLHIYGEGKLYDSLKKQIESLGLQKSVFLDGRVSEVGKVLSLASLFVLPSDVEGAPNALMEAMAVGVPSISTDCPCGGPNMLLENSKAGLLVPVNDKEKMAAAIIKLLKSPQLCTEMSQNAKKAAIKFHENEVYKLWLNYISSILYE